jgi:alanine racemase
MAAKSVTPAGVAALSFKDGVAEALWSPAARREIALASASRALLEIDLSAIRHNLSVIRRFTHGARLMAVVKGDAYGLGAPVISRLLEDNGVEAFAVDSIAEAIALRVCGIGKPILIIDGDVPENIPFAVAHQLMPGIAQEELLLAYENFAARRGVRHPVWLVANVGFNRSGHRQLERFTRFALRASECQHLEVKGVYAHLSNSNGEAGITLAQIESFQRVADSAREIFGAEIETSLFASHGLLRWSGMFQTGWLRPGLILYGEHAFIEELIEPETAEALQEMRPAVSLRARITQVLDFESEEGIGYGHIYKTSAGQRLATVSLGHGSGYPYGARGLEVLVKGMRAPLAGAVGMDALQVDITRVPNVSLYDWVTLVGVEGNERISVRDLARAAMMSPYELLRQLRAQRQYIDSEKGSSHLQQ